jgi:Family of unknown function (DUF6339)
MSELKTLAPTGRAALTSAFLEDRATVDVSKHVRDFQREISLKPLAAAIEEAMRRFPDHKEESDAWLAPRVHSLLRLTRREAADRGPWSYLAVVEFPEYVRWRWGTTLERFTGTDVNQALSRLWWGAELTRNGSDYSLVETSFEAQDIPNTWFRLKAFHHRPAAIAAMRVIADLRGSKDAAGQSVKRTRKINLLSTAFNTELTTLVLDAIAPYGGVDAEALQEWIEGEPDETLVMDELPEGPPEEALEEELVVAVEAELRRIAETAKLLGDDD